jgi:hypothetical protein
MAFCANCGTKLKEGAKFCPECGTPVKQAEQTAAPETAALEAAPAPAAPVATPAPMSEDEKIAAFEKVAHACLADAGLSDWGKDMWMGHDIPEKILAAAPKAFKFQNGEKPLLVHKESGMFGGIKQGQCFSTWGIHQQSEIGNIKSSDGVKDPAHFNFDLSWSEFITKKCTIDLQTDNSGGYSTVFLTITDSVGQVVGTISVIQFMRDETTKKAKSTLPLNTALQNLIPEAAKIFGV